MPNDNTSVAVKGNGSNTSTGGASAFNWGSIIEGVFNGAIGLTDAIFRGKAIQNGNYYTEYNQGENNAYNSMGTIIFLVAGITAIVLLLKRK